MWQVLTSAVPRAVGGHRPERGPPPARRVCEVLVGRRVLVKDTHGRTLRLAPPLVISEDELRWAVGEIADVLSTDR